MPRTQFAAYIHTDRYGKRSKTTWKMTAEEAAKLVDPEIIPSSIEYRNVPAPGAPTFGPSYRWATGYEETKGQGPDTKG